MKNRASKKKAKKEPTRKVLKKIRVNKKKRYEKKIIRDFLLFKEFKVVNWMELNENPDAKVLVNNAGRQIKIAIEHTDYYVDALHGTPSTGKQIYAFWHEVQASMNRRVSKRFSLRHITGVVTLDASRLLSLIESIPRSGKKERAKKLARSMAAELIKLSLKYDDTGPNSMQDIRTFSKEELPVSNQYVKKVTLMGTGSALVSWVCVDSSVSSIGVFAEEIASIIRNKAKDFPRYHWGDVDERWLLISASGATVFNSAGPHPELVDWNSFELKDACRTANIEHVIFWDRIYNWYKEICPSAALVKREWRARTN